jgi:hypothetical protein
MIKKEEGKWVLYDSEGKEILGIHDTKEEAIRQEIAIKKSTIDS